jgi:guanylate kinase
MNEILTDQQLFEIAKPLFPYHAPANILEELQDRHLVTLSAPSAMGKDSVRNRILASDQRFVKLVSFTTRAPQLREGIWEQDGIDYNFYHEDREKVLQKLTRRLAVQAAIPDESIDIYGSTLDQYRPPDKINLFDVVATQAVDFLNMKTFDKKVAVSLTAPFNAWRDRFERSRAKLSEDRKQARIKEAKHCMDVCLSDERIKFVDNTLTLDEAVRSIIDLVDRPSEQTERKAACARVIAEKFFKDLKDHLGEPIIIS